MQSVWKGEHALPNTCYGVSPSGWMTSVIFEDWFNGFIKEVTIRPLLLIFDGHLTHLTLKTITTAMEENITILKLVADSTDTMQPLDVSCFSPLKSYYERALLTFNESHGGRIKLNVSKFVDLCCSVWHKGISSTNAISGFKATSIFPVNRNKYKLESFDAKKLETYNVWKANGSPLDKYGDADLSKIISIEEAVSNPVYHDKSFSVDTPCSSKETMVESPERTPTVPRAMDLNRTPSAEVTPSKMSAVRLIKACQRHAPKGMKYVLSLVPDDSDESFQSIIRSRKTSKPVTSPEKRRYKMKMASAVITEKEFVVQLEKKKNEEDEKKRKSELRAETKLKKVNSEVKAKSVAKKKVHTKHAAKNKFKSYVKQATTSTSTPARMPVLSSSDSDNDFELDKFTFTAPSNEKQCLEIVRKVWKAICPPVVESNLLGNWFAAIYVVDARYKYKLFVGKVSRRFLKDKDGIAHFLELDCLKQATGSTVELYEIPSHLPIDTGLFEIPNVIAGPLNGIYINDAKWKFSEYPAVVQMFEMVIKLNRCAEYCKIYGK